MNRTVLPKRLAYLLILVGAAFAMTFAPTQEGMAQNKKKTRGKKARGEPFERVKSNRRYFRVVGQAYSSRKDLALRKAKAQAQAAIAAEIQVVVKQVNDDYVKETETEEGVDFMASFETLTRTVVNETLYGAEQVDQAIYTKYRTKEDKKRGRITYYAYVVMEMKRDYYLQELEKRAAGDDKNKKVDYNKAKYEEIFDKEMQSRGGDDEGAYDPDAEGEGGEWDATDEEPDNE